MSMNRREYVRMQGTVDHKSDALTIELGVDGPIALLGCAGGLCH